MYNNVTYLLLDTVWIIISISMPPIIVAMALGIAVSIFQALTQIQEQTLSFAIKLTAIVIVISIMSSWMVAQITKLFEVVLIIITQEGIS